MRLVGFNFTCSSQRKLLTGVQSHTIVIITYLVIGTNMPCIDSVTCQLDSIHHVNHAFVEPQCKHLRVNIMNGNDVPLPGHRVTSDRRIISIGRVRIGIRGVANVLNGEAIPRGLKVPLVTVSHGK